MDDQLQTNSDQTVPSTPIDITPQNTVEPEVPLQMPVTVDAPAVEPTLIPTVQTEQTVDVPPLPIANESANTAESPISATQETSTSPIPEPETVVSEPNATESPLPEPKKKKISPVIMGVLALFLVAGIGGAAYYVSNQLSTRQAVAPTAPESKPMAADGCSGECRDNCNEGEKGSGTCITSGKICCVPSGGGGGGVGVCYNTDGTPKYSGTIVACGSLCCHGDNPVCCCTGCFPAGTDCSLHTCGGGGGGETAVNGGWGAYSACSSTTCGTPGTKTRTCNNPAPANGGSECTRTDGTTTTASNRVETVSCTPTGCVIGACTNVKIYKKPGGVGAYGTTALSENQLQQLKVGDELKFVTTANTSGLRGKFIVTVNGNVTTLDGTTSAGTITYTDYLVSAAGTYKFEGQVSVIP